MPAYTRVGCEWVFRNVPRVLQLECKLQRRMRVHCSKANMRMCLAQKPRHAEKNPKMHHGHLSTSKLLSTRTIACTASASIGLHPKECVTSAAKNIAPCTYNPVTSRSSQL